MILRNAIAGGALAAIAHAAQPGAVEPVASPMRDLTWGQLNFLHTTDTHGWLGGHFQEPQYSADWGDYISFSHHMRNHADEKGVDLLLVDTGDRIEGNGLYDSSTPKGLFQYDIYAQQSVDIICTGNHELYKAYSSDRENDTTVPNFKENYIASNLDYIDFETGDQKPMAQRYRKFKTKNLGLEIVAFGFIFDFTGNDNNTIVQRVEDTIKEDWFKEAIHEKPDLFVVIGHVGLRMEEFKIIFTELRKQNWHIPIAFFGGHAHVRDALSYDSNAFAMASGRYFETIGWMSMDGFKQKEKGPDKEPDEVSASKSLSFTRKYIDTNLYGMYHHTGLNETTFPTKDGQKTSEMIQRARKALDLDSQFGCAPKNLWMTRAKYPSEDSIYSWITDELLPDVITTKGREDKPRLAILNTGGIRFDIFKGAFTRDSTYIVSPFTSGFRYIPDVPYKVAQKVIGILNSGGTILKEYGVDTRFLAIPEQMFPAHVYPAEETEEPRLELRGVLEPLDGSKDEPEPIRGYTTKDDIDDEGDDTIHKVLKFYNQPNCVQSEIRFPEEDKPETVDLVFLDFLQPWMIPALKFSGGDYSNEDVEQYMEGTFTYKMAQWISENWKGEC
ncbi:Fc.00g057340.m01.CDS01 [Cosmosporella sp. VM-42]